NQPLTSGTLPSNTIPNPKGEMKVVTTRSGLAYEGPSIPTESPLEKVDEQNTKEILDKEHSNSSGSTAEIQPPVVPISIPEPDVPRTQSKPSIPYTSRLNDQKLREKAINQMEKFFQNFHDLHFDISFADALLLMPKFASTIKSLLANKDKLFDLAKEQALISCPYRFGKKLSLLELTPTRLTLELADRSINHPKGVAEDVFVNVGKFRFPTDFIVVDFEADPRVPLILGSNPTLVSKSDFCKDPIVKISPFGESDFFSEEIKDFLNDDLIPTGIENYVYDPEGDILYFVKLLKEDPIQLPLMNLNQAKSPMEEPEYSFSMGYEHFITTPVTKLDEVVESSAKNLVPIQSEYEVTLDNESKREHAEYISLMERLITINLYPRPTINANTVVESLPSSLIPVQDNDSQREHIDIVTDTDELLPPGFENDDSEGEIYVLEELQPPDAEFDFEPEAEEEISVVMNNNDELECLNPVEKFDISTNKKDDNCFSFIFVIRISLPYIINPKVFSFLLSAESEDTIFDPGLTPR
nr:hypothetical protein [Tanacetum cinerariifolium]